jgi:lysophospholipase L1-like esterase
VKRRPVWLALPLTLTLALVAPAPLARAEEPAQIMSIVALGDSYTAGNGTGATGDGTYYGPSLSYRSHLNYAALYTQWLLDQGVHARLTTLATSGALVGDVADQLAAASFPADADLAVLTIGGNDMGFLALVVACLTPATQSEASCRTAIEKTAGVADAVAAGTAAVFDALDARLKPGARIVLLGYPLLAADTGTELADLMRQFGRDMEQRQRELVEAWAAGHDREILYLGANAAFAGHEPDADGLVAAPRRWLNEFFETAGVDDGTATAGRTSLDAANFFHPNRSGHAAYAQLLIDAVGVPDDLERVAVCTGPYAYVDGPWLARTGTELAFDARASYADNGPVTVDWDFDGDGVFEELAAGPTASHTYAEPFLGRVQIRVTDASGEVAVGSAKVEVTATGSAEAAADATPDVTPSGGEPIDGCEPDFFALLREIIDQIRLLIQRLLTLF